MNENLANIIQQMKQYSPKLLLSFNYNVDGTVDFNGSMGRIQEENQRRKLAMVKSLLLIVTLNGKYTIRVRGNDRNPLTHLSYSYIQTNIVLRLYTLSGSVHAKQQAHNRLKYTQYCITILSTIQQYIYVFIFVPMRHDVCYVFMRKTVYWLHPIPSYPFYSFLVSYLFQTR